MPKLYVEGPDCTWTVPGQQTRSAIRVDVPASPPELAAWLNERRVPIDSAGQEIELVFEPESTTAPPAPDTRTPRAAELLAQGDDADAIAAWIFAAQGWQIEKVLAAIGARVAELRNGGGQ